MEAKPIYVEINIHSSLDQVWEATQTPSKHEQWDIRFSSIKYLPKAEGEPQHFTYERTVLPPFKIKGWGISAGDHNGKNGARTSSLHFGTNMKSSPIKEGKGYWKYEPQDEHVNFMTQYDYEVPFGKFGSLIDRILIRPLMGWGTALSFDVLRRWLENSESPRSQYMRFFCSWLITFFFCFIWIYHGLVPKLIFMHPKEITMITDLIPLSYETGYRLVQIAGGLEIFFGVCLLIFSRKRLLFFAMALLFPLLAIVAITADPQALQAPFNPLTFNLSLMVLSIIGFFLHKELPSARNCRRKRK
ncbi:DoxX-like family protein [Cytobacillus horneckiae]|uniref:DoxX-like family protein n=1 Tax=Cytobacillus horneckiae TaxID=549687 RepID=UPI003D243C2C